MLVPDKLKPSADERETLRANANGDQIYVCDGSSWMLSKPGAKLFAHSEKQIERTLLDQLGSILTEAELEQSRR